MIRVWSSGAHHGRRALPALYLFGFGFFGDIRLFRPQKPFLLTGYINAACFGLRAESKLKFRTDVVAVEDMALSGMNAYYHRYLFVDQRLPATSLTVSRRLGGPPKSGWKQCLTMRPLHSWC
jgi:hypothetical protein